MHTRPLVALALAVLGMVAAPAAVAQSSGSSGGNGAPGIAPNSLVNPSIEITGFTGAPPNLCATPIGSHSIATLWTSSLPADSDSDSFDVLVPGFGDVSAVSDAARIVVIVQIVLDLLLLGVVVRLLLGAGKAAAEARKTQP